jgi:hypothetical protein
MSIDPKHAQVREKMNETQRNRHIAGRVMSLKGVIPAVASDHSHSYLIR